MFLLQKEKDLPIDSHEKHPPHDFLATICEITAV